MTPDQIDRRVTHLENEATHLGNEARHLRKHLAESQPQPPERVELGDGAWWRHNPENGAAYVHMKPTIGNFGATDDVGRGLCNWLCYGINKPNAPAAVRAYARARERGLIQHADPALAFLCGEMAAEPGAIPLGHGALGWQFALLDGKPRSQNDEQDKGRWGTPGHSSSNKLEVLRRARVLGLVAQEPQPPAPRACHNAACPHQRGGVCHTAASAADIANCLIRVAEPPAAGAVGLGEWRGWKLVWNRPGTPDGSVTVSDANDMGRVYWKPGIACASSQPAETNALLTAYRRAVARGLAMWPETGWEWAKGAASRLWYETHGTATIWLGIFKPGAYCIWPIDDVGHWAYGEQQQAESRRRAAMLGLCQPAPESADKGMEPSDTLRACARHWRENANKVKAGVLTSRDSGVDTCPACARWREKGTMNCGDCPLKQDGEICCAAHFTFFQSSTFDNAIAVAQYCEQRANELAKPVPAEKSVEWQLTPDELAEVNQIADKMATDYCQAVGPVIGKAVRETLDARDEEIKRLTRQLATMTKSREMWRTSSVENAAEIKRLRKQEIPECVRYFCSWARGYFCGTTDADRAARQRLDAVRDYYRPPDAA